MTSTRALLFAAGLLGLSSGCLLTAARDGGPVSEVPVEAGVLLDSGPSDTHDGGPAVAADAGGVDAASDAGDEIVDDGGRGASEADGGDLADAAGGSEADGGELVCATEDACTRNIDCAGGSVCRKEEGDEVGCCVVPPCERTLCLNGFGSRTSGANNTLEGICYSFTRGIVESCDADGCLSTFRWDDSTGALEALVLELDSDADGDVDASDEECEVNLVGYSWGGLNAIDVAGSFLSDSRVALERRVVDRMIVLDPFKPNTPAEYTVPAGVARFWSYRHSIEATDDCSSNLLFGPYLGRAPLCYAASDCLDYDYSLQPSDEFFGFAGGTYLGSAIGHCDIVDVAAGGLYQNLRGVDGNALPTPAPVQEP